MDYALAKELKDAGFPQDRSPWVYYVCQTSGHKPHSLLKIRNGLIGYKPEEVLGWIAAPTLEELIEACGGKNMDITSDFESRWHAHSYTYVKSGDGHSPTEAVARLWLARNKRS